MEADYLHVKRAVEEAGFFTTFMPAAGDPDDPEPISILVCAAKQRPDGGLTGNSFWITTRDGKWFVATWMNHFYRIPDASRVAELCAAWLAIAPNATPYDVDDRVKERFGLVETDETELGLPPIPVYDNEDDEV